MRRDVPTPWAHKGLVMRAVLEAAGDRPVDTTDGVRVVEDDGWALVLPDPAEAVTRLWAEASTRGRGRRAARRAGPTSSTAQVGEPVVAASPAPSAGRQHRTDPVTQLLGEIWDNALDPGYAAAAAAAAAAGPAGSATAATATAVASGSPPPSGWC